jgi:hypothetical protein
MGFLSKIFGEAAEATVGTAVTSVGNVLDNLFTSDEERLQAEERMKLIDMKPQEAQWQTNQIEAANGKSWRHWVGRVCAISLALYFIPQYAMGAALWLKISLAALDAGKEILPPYPVTVDGLMELVTGMLGLGAIKSVEVLADKIKKK